MKFKKIYILSCILVCVVMSFSIKNKYENLKESAPTGPNYINYYKKWSSEEVDIAKYEQLLETLNYAEYNPIIKNSTDDNKVVVNYFDVDDKFLVTSNFEKNNLMILNVRLFFILYPYLDSVTFNYYDKDNMKHSHTFARIDFEESGGLIIDEFTPIGIDTLNYALKLREKNIKIYTTNAMTINTTMSKDKKVGENTYKIYLSSNLDEKNYESSDFILETEGIEELSSKLDEFDTVTNLVFIINFTETNYSNDEKQNILDYLKNECDNYMEHFNINYIIE